MDKESQGADIRAGMKRYFSAKLTQHHLRVLRKRLAAPLEDIVALSREICEVTPFPSLMKGNPVKFSDISDALFDAERQPWERAMGLAMFRTWLAAPSDSALQLRALRSFVRGYAEKLERTRQSIDLWSQGINALSARLNTRNREFYTGIYQDVGGLPAVTAADPQSVIDRQIRSSAVWMFEALIMFNALQTLRDVGGVPALPTYRQAKHLVAKHSWRPRSTCFDPPSAPREEKTIENNLRNATLAPMIVYAAYLTEFEGQGTLLDAIVNGKVQHEDVLIPLKECLSRARSVYLELTPRTLLKKAGVAKGLPKKAKALPLPVAASKEIAISLQGHLGSKPGRPKSSPR